MVDQPAEIVMRSARVLLLDGDDLVLIKRTKPKMDPYWVTVGGGVEPQDASVAAALHREVFEELGGTCSTPQLVLLISDAVEGGIGVQHIFAARLLDMDVSARTGTEFAKPERGGYEIVRIPFTREALADITLMPPDLAQFAADNTEAITSVADCPVDGGPTPAGAVR